MERTYWNRRLTRRGALKTTAAAGGGLALIALTGCGDDNSGKPASPVVSAPTVGALPTPAKAAKRGGTFNVQLSGNPPTFNQFENSATLSSYVLGLAYSKLFRYKGGTPDIVPTDPSNEPDLAAKLEQPDNLTYRITLKKATFHNLPPVNGRAVTAEDVRYALTRFATDAKSPHSAPYFWLDRIEAPDASTVLIKAKVPYADVVDVLASYFGAIIIPREFAESDKIATGMLGSGPFMLTDFRSGTSLAFERNPNYFDQPYPYFDKINAFIVGDTAKQIADFTAGREHLTWNLLPDQRDEVKKARPDARLDSLEVGAHKIFFKQDGPPFTDARLRQAVSMALDRGAIRNIIAKGEGVPDTILGVGLTGWARQVKDLGANAKYWDYNKSEAKALMSAAGYNGEELEFVHVAEAAVYGQNYLDVKSLVVAQMKDVGFNIKEAPLPYAQFIDPVNGVVYGRKYKNFGLFSAGGIFTKVDGISDYLSFSNGIYGRTNVGLTNDPALQVLLDKQRTQFKQEERLQTIKQIEDMTAEKQYWAMLNTVPYTYASDPKLQNYRPGGFYTWDHFMKSWLDS